MISEERLKELLKKEVTIYRANGYIEEIYLNENDFEVSGKELVFNYKIYAVSLEDLFETEEEAEEYLKYGNVTRTEKFPYVSWEEFCDGKTFSSCNPMKRTTYFVWKERNYIYIKEYYGVSSERIFFREPLTKENYHKALDLAIRLWKGEEK